MTRFFLYKAKKNHRLKRWSIRSITLADFLKRSQLILNQRW